MGLNIYIQTEDKAIYEEVFDGAYSAFDRLRCHILDSIGGIWPTAPVYGQPSKKWYWRKDKKPSEDYSSVKTPGLYELFTHSDCDGEISWEKAGLLAKDLTDIMPLIKRYEQDHQATGHLSELGIAGTVEKMINGLKIAYELKATITFG